MNLNIEASLLPPLLERGCASGLDAIGYGFKEIQNGNYDIAIAGGSDASITPLIMAGLCASNIMSKRNEIS
jgi:3-oxoacyl-[acyl-carrier-protein] synthase II